MTDLAAEERERRLNETGKIVVKKTGIGQDVYAWRDVALELDHGVLMIRDNDGLLIHAYSSGAWLEVTEVDE